MKALDQRTGKSTDGRGATRGLVRAVAVVPIVFALFALFAPAAWAHEGSARITCKKVTYSFSDFPNKPGNTVQETVYEDGFRIDSQSYTFNGSTGGNVISNLVVGSQSIKAEASWDTNGVSGSFEDSRDLVGCGGIG
jgi:hypothetical protein